MIKQFKSLAVTSSPNIVDWTKHKVIVFQSDDWGFCGWVPDLKAYQKLHLHDRVENRQSRIAVFTKSTLESPSDLDRLFNVLEKYTGGDGRPVVFQPAYIMSAPDYEAIKASGYKTYSDLVIPKVPSRWERGDFIAKAKEGFKKGIWYPVYHGNTHGNMVAWMERVRANRKDVMAAFNYQTCVDGSMTESDEYNQALSFRQQRALIARGIQRFFEVFGYYPVSAIAPNYVWQQKTELALAEHGIKVIQGKNLQQLQRPFLHKIMGKTVNLLGNKSADKTWQISMGDYNRYLKLYYLNRNVDFEPRGKEVAAERSYQEIVSAWQRNEPAIVNTHRVNYVYLDESWVAKNLDQLDKLLNTIRLNHPTAVYLTDYEVVQLYESGKSLMPFGNMIVCRNYTPEKKRFNVPIPLNSKIVNVKNLQTRSEIEFERTNTNISFVADEGDYAIQLGS
ncbi:MAG: hypothetical protein ONB05_08540 [candidate division KSB1 bacterium]|nr:hypothetical protein [candidate division KSB1 bacterium]